MATNILTAYLNEGFDDGFVTDLVDYVKNKPGTKIVSRDTVVSRDSVEQDGVMYDLIKIERDNHLSMYGETACRIDPPESDVTVSEYGDWLCDFVDSIM